MAPSAGRPRDEAVRGRILAAAREILEAEGLAGFTMAAVASRARVSRQTLYTWWPSRGAVALDALADYAARAISVVPAAQRGTGEAALLEFVRQTFRALVPTVRSVLRALMAEAQQDPDLAAAFRARLIDVRRAQLLEVLAEVLPATATRADAEYAADVIFGVMWYRLLVQHGPLDDELAKRLVVTVVGANRGTK